jgi:hypothetical protein
MYVALVIVHSWLRWLVLAAGVLAVTRAIGGRASGRGWQAADEAAGRWFVISLDLQTLIGLVLYFFLSPYTVSAWSDVAGTMRDPFLRFMAVEHLVGMLAGVALAHIGRARVRRQTDAAQRNRQAAIFFGLSLVAILASVPWPFMAAGRPLLRGF